MGEFPRADAVGVDDSNQVTGMLNRWSRSLRYDFLVLNGSHLKKMASAAEIAAAVGVASDVARSALAAAVERAGRWTPTENICCFPTDTAVVHDFYAPYILPSVRPGFSRMVRALRIDQRSVP